MNEEYEVVHLTVYGDEEEQPDLKANNLRFPEFCRYIEDEEMTFVINMKSGEFWKTEDFFHMNRVQKFKVTK